MTTATPRWFEDADLGEEYRGPLPAAGPLHDYFWEHTAEANLPPGQFLDLAQRHNPEHHTPWSRPVLPGDMCMALALDVLTVWAGSRGRVCSLDARFRRPIYLDDRIEWVALVTDTEPPGAVGPGSDRSGVVRLDLYFENERGERPVQGVAIVELPLREASNS